jgi:hypothetical protein
MKTIFRNLFTVIACVGLLTACEESIDRNSGITDPVRDPSKAPTGVSTGNILDDRGTSIDISGSVSGDGGSAILDNGFLLHTDANFTIESANLIVGSSTTTSTGSFEATVGGLKNGTLYYYQAYSYNANGIALGDKKSLTTSKAIPTPYTSSFNPDVPAEIAGWVFDKYTGFDESGLDLVWFSSAISTSDLSCYSEDEPITLVSPLFRISGQADILGFYFYACGYGSPETKVKVYITEDLNNYGEPVKDWTFTEIHTRTEIPMEAYFEKNVYVVIVIEEGDLILYNFSVAPK